MLGFRLFFIGIIASALIGAGVYVMKLRSDNAILKANQIKLESAVAEQQQLITKQKEDFEEILAANISLKSSFCFVITSCCSATADSSLIAFAFNIALSDLNFIT